MESIQIDDSLISIGQTFKCSKCQEIKKIPEFITYKKSGIFKLSNIYCKTCLDMKNNVVASLEFTILKEAILSLFNLTFSLHGYIYNYADLQAGMRAHNFKKIMNILLINAVGNVESFCELLRIELDRFFDVFPEYFTTGDERLIDRRFYEYKRLIQERKLCKRKFFKRDLIDFIKLDLAVCYEKNSNKFLEKYKDVSTRQKIVLASIKNFIFRTFLINEYCSE